MIEGTRDRLVLLNEKGEVLEYNSAFAEQFKDDEDAVIYGRHISSIYSIDPALTEAEPHPLITDALLQGRQVGRHYGYLGAEAIEVELSRLEIQEHSLLVLSARPLDDKARHERELASMRTQLDELTERLSVERERERAQRVEALALLAGTLAHDLNNALAVVCGNLELLEMSIEDMEGLQASILETIQDIREGVTSASGLSERLKTFTKGESAELKPLELRSWLKEISRALSKAHQDRLKLNLPVQELWVNADDSQLSQLVINLVSNAFQAMDAQTRDERKLVTLTLQVGRPETLSSLMYSQDHPLNSAQSYVHVSILDQGPGIPEEHLQKIFDPFFSTKQGGSGIGLASAMKVTFGHRGGISAENRPEGGACFHVALPTLKRLSSHEQQTTSAPIGRLTFPDLTIILMDDEPHIRLTLKKILMLHDAQVYEASGCDELLSIREQVLRRELPGRPELLFLLDLNIEGGPSGVDTLQRLKRLDPSVRAIACSGYFPLQEGDTYEKLGFKAHIPKPFTAEELTRVIHRVMSGGS